MELKDIKEIVENLKYLIDANRKVIIRNIIIDLHPADLAEILHYLNEENSNYIFSLLNAEVASDVIAEMDDISRDKILDDLDEQRISEIVDEMDSDDATDLVSDLPDDMVQKVLDSIDKEDSEEVIELLTHDEDTAGGIMAKEYVAVNKNLTVQQVIDEIRTKSEEVDDLYYIWVVDNEDKLVGIVSLKVLILASPKVKISEIMDPEIVSVKTDMDQEEVANIAKKYDLVSIPVTDDHGKLVGRITFDDVADVMEEEASEDMQRMAGITDEEEFRETSILRISQVRLPWLLVGFVGQLGSAFILSRFEASLSQIIAAAFFIPIIMAMGGNAGIQSSTIMVRGMATGEIDLFEIRKRLFREIAVSLLNGLICGFLLYLVVSVFLKQASFGLLLGVVLFFIIIMASFMGALIPVILKKINIDPAIATGPFITTSNDVIGLLIYLGLITEFLPHL
ncbi:magnesium transporter [candidate division KSB1 bacterium 4572_119]|nr:MAG: magnesium transporter [candidate division KSB1 bacterium 4572_119]